MNQELSNTPTLQHSNPQPPTMRKLTYAINVTLDGCCDHTQGIADDELHSFFTNLLEGAGVLAYGRITYQLMVPFWTDIAQNPSGHPEAYVAFARAFDAAEKVVFSQSLEKAEDKNSRIVRTAPEKEILELKQQSGGDILLGGVALPAYMAERGLIDEFIFVIQPIVVGGGRRLLEGITTMNDLQLVETTTLKSGCVVVRYRKG